jgi:hypothetical protein
VFRFTRKKSGRNIQPLDERLLAVFKGGDGFGQILFFWALMLSILGLAVFTVIGFAFQNGAALLCGLAAGRCYFYLGNIGKDILADILPVDG